MGKLIFITGGARSGKSTLAVKLAKAIKKPKVFIATCVPDDAEMKKRVKLHQRSRPATWRTVEAGGRLVAALEKEGDVDKVIIVDCVTLFVSWLLVNGIKEKDIKREVATLLKVIATGKAMVILVSNEVGAGLVPENKLGRDFRDIAGTCNQIVAAAADDVYLTVSGIPIKIK